MIKRTPATGPQTPQEQCAPSAVLFENSRLSENLKKNGISLEELPDFYDDYQALSEKCARAYLNGPSHQFPFKSESDFIIWARQGIRLLKKTPEGETLCLTYFEAADIFLKQDYPGYLEIWTDLAIEITEYSAEVAEVFLQTTPLFLSWGRVFHLRKRAENAMRILSFGEDRKPAAKSYLMTSSNMDGLLFSLVAKDWQKTGIYLARQSAEEAAIFFKTGTDVLRELYQTEIKKILGCVSVIAETSPQKGVAFYREASHQIQKINPNSRENALKLSISLAAEKDQIPDIFSCILAALCPYAYPVQESILQHARAIAEFSKEAAIGYFQSVNPFLEEVPDKYLHFWVEEGLPLLKENPDDGCRYFFLKSRRSKHVFNKWKEAVSFEEIKVTLALFVQALSGRHMTVVETEKDTYPEKGLYPEGDGYTISLPPYLSEEKTKAENYALYKITAAHQAGYVEFGTFSPQYSKLWFFLEGFPIPALAFDIFYIIEDGRIDYLLKKEYPGLSPELEKAVSAWIGRRQFPGNVVSHGILEILLILSSGEDGAKTVPPAMRYHYDYLMDTLSGFYKNSKSVWDSFVKTCQIYRYMTPFLEDVSYETFMPLPLRERPHPSNHPGQTPLMIPPDKLLDSDMDGLPEDNAMLSPEDLEKLLESLANLAIPKKPGSDMTPSGLFLSGLENALAPKKGDKETSPSSPEDKKSIAQNTRSMKQETFFKYNEWDHLLADYRKNWCTLREKMILPETPERYYKIFGSYRDLIQKVKKQFQQIRPAILETVRGVEQGDELHMPAVIQGVVDRKAGDTPSERIFIRKEKIKRRISTVLLIDMSASTGENISEIMGENADYGENDPDKRVIDIEIESLVVMIEALEALDDDYAVYGFSGKGKENVDFYIIKDFTEPYSEKIKQRVSGIAPQQSTRMGTAIRHASLKLKNVDSDHRLLILISDGFPQDLDYGENRRSKAYALNDTMMALIEAGKEGVRTFCITVDQAGHDYLKRMCNPGSYLVIKDIFMLPEILPKVVESLMY